MWKSNNTQNTRFSRFLFGITIPFALVSTLTNGLQEYLMPERSYDVRFRHYPEYSYPPERRYFRPRPIPYRRLSHATIVITDDQPAIVGDYRIYPVGTSASEVHPRSHKQKILPPRDPKSVYPMSDIRYIKYTIEHGFSSVRDDSDNGKLKSKARNKVVRKMKKYGLDVILHNFTAIELKDADDMLTIDGVNVVGILHGSKSGTQLDKILLIGAHYDTVPDSPGVDDNGSGIAALLEIARVLSIFNCKFKNTVMFVAFDMEEVGGFGSLYFIREFLVPNILEVNKGQFQGAYILDSVLNYDDSVNSQEVPPDFKLALPSLSRYIALGGYRGNFLAMMSRWNIDEHLATNLLKSWEKLPQPQYKLFSMGINLGNNIPPPLNVLAIHLNFLRSDHVKFWYHNSSTGPSSLNAVLITDTAPFRGRMKQCYHSACDNLSLLTTQNLEFVKKLVDALIMTVLNIAEGFCPDPAQAQLLRNNNCNSIHQMSLSRRIIFTLFVWNFMRNVKIF